MRITSKFGARYTYELLEIASVEHDLGSETQVPVHPNQHTKLAARFKNIFHFISFWG